MRKFKKGDIVCYIGGANPDDYSYNGYVCESAYKNIFTVGKPIMAGDVFLKEDAVSVPRNDGIYLYADPKFFMLKSEYDMQQNKNKKEVNRIPFDLERAKKGDKVINSNGQPVRIICFDRCVGDQSLSLVALHNEHGCEVARYHFKNGCETCEDEFNLFMAPVEKTGWIGIIDAGYKSPNSTRIFDTEQEVLNNFNECWDASCKLICTKQITWEQ